MAKTSEESAKGSEDVPAHTASSFHTRANLFDVVPALIEEIKKARV